MKTYCKILSLLILMAMMLSILASCGGEPSGNGGDETESHDYAALTKLDMSSETAKEEVTVSGSLLNKAGIRLAQTFAGTGYNPGTDLYQDYDAAIYYMEETCG